MAWGNIALVLVAIRDGNDRLLKENLMMKNMYSIAVEQETQETYAM
jgi:hypothetical protein